MIPEVFAAGTIAREGEAGAAWIARLPALVEELLDRWDCRPDGPPGHGGIGLIIPVRREGEPAVVKVSFPHPGNVHEPDALAAWDGHGAVRLFERSDEEFAMLLERAGPVSLANAFDLDCVVTEAASVSRRLAIPAPSTLPSLVNQADQWAADLDRDIAEFPTALPARVLAEARSTIADLGRSQPRQIIHGDLHPGNILSSEREPWLAIDPKGLVGDPGFDAGILVKVCVFTVGRDIAPTANRVLDILAETAELNRERLRRWAQLTAVQASFWGRRHGFAVARSGDLLDLIVAGADELSAELTC